MIQVYTTFVFVVATLLTGAVLVDEKSRYGTMIGYIIMLPIYFRAMGWI